MGLFCFDARRMIYDFCDFKNGFGGCSINHAQVKVILVGIIGY